MTTPFFSASRMPFPCLDVDILSTQKSSHLRRSYFVSLSFDIHPNDGLGWVGTLQTKSVQPIPIRRSVSEHPIFYDLPTISLYQAVLTHFKSTACAHFLLRRWVAEGMNPVMVGSDFFPRCPTLPSS